MTLAGIVVVAWAGAKKDGDLSPDQKLAAVAEFDFKKGIAVAIFSGIMSACFAFGLAAGEPIKALSRRPAPDPLWTGLPALCLVMFGGLITNGVWCAYPDRQEPQRGEWVGIGRPTRRPKKPPLLANYPAVRAGRHGLVLPVLLLHDGREPDGQVRLLQLDPAHGQHHHLRHPVGLRLQGVARQVRAVAIGGQDCHPAAEGACTGGVSAAMLREAGATITLVGHSETREDGLSVAAKARAAQSAGLAVVICVGEGERSADASGLVAAQLRASLPPDLDWSRASIAYEPVWCIGGDSVPDVAHLARIFEMLRTEASEARLLYGGAVDGGNAAELLALRGVDGLLVGRASRLATDFVPVLKASAGG
jgi:triosephosphate isomerase